MRYRNQDMREAVETLGRRARAAREYLALMLADVDAGTYNPDNAGTDAECETFALLFEALGEVQALADEAAGCDCPACESDKGDCMAGFCGLCLTEVGTDEPWGAVCDDCGGES